MNWTCQFVFIGCNGNFYVFFVCFWKCENLLKTWNCLAFTRNEISNRCFHVNGRRKTERTTNNNWYVNHTTANINSLGKWKIVFTLESLFLFSYLCPVALSPHTLCLSFSLWNTHRALHSTVHIPLGVSHLVWKVWHKPMDLIRISV